MHGLLDSFAHRCSILGKFARRQFNAIEGIGSSPIGLLRLLARLWRR
jgi:hypothetical protein